MKANYNNILRSGLLVIVCVCGLSCKKTFDNTPGNVLVPENMYRDVNDADAAIFGLFGKVQTVMERYTVLNELRGDLMDVTQNADKYLKQLNEHTVTTDNPWADPKPYYSIIIDCNDIMNNFNLMLKSKRISQANYGVRYSEVAAVWAWTYLQLGIHYGSVPYVTDNLANIEDLKDTSKFPMVTFDQLLDKLIGVVSALPALRPIQVFVPQGVNTMTAEGLSLIRTIDGYDTKRMFLNKQFLLGDLYLWKGDYTQASRYLRMPLEYGIIVDPSKADLYLQYNREYPSVNGNANWAQMFTSALDADDKTDILTNLPFDRSFSPANPFVKLFSHNGKYLLKPSALAIKNWNSQTGTDGTPGDTWRGAGRSYSVGAEPEVRKLLGQYNPAVPSNTNGKTILYRAGGCMMHYAESANRDGRDQVATAFINGGFKASIFIGPAPVPTNRTNVQQNFDPNPDYYFDARVGDFPVIRGSWLRFEGMRGHVSLAPSMLDSTKYFDMSNKSLWDKPITNAKGLMLDIENRLVDENALEMAYEGVRWPDLLRIALRREKETPGSGLSFLRGKIAAKFATAGLPVPAGVASLGTSTANWYMPFKW